MRSQVNRFLQIILMTQLLNLACNKPSERFISEEQLRNQLAQQVLSNESKVQQLSQFGVDERSGISIDFSSLLTIHPKQRS